MESFHLFFPFVFAESDEIDMVPESHQANSVRLYKAVDLPIEWWLAIDGLEKKAVSGWHY
jgi:hypothetical protein